MVRLLNAIKPISTMEGVLGMQSVRPGRRVEAENKGTRIRPMKYVGSWRY